MATFLDDLVVGVLLLGSVMYAAYSLGPKALRQRMLTMGGSVLPGRVGRRLQRAAASKASGACGGCDNCGSAEKPAASGIAAAKAGEVRVPLSRISKRADR